MKNTDLFGEKAKTTLYIIGNGFDIHHGLDTRYSDYQNYLYGIGESYLVGQLESFYPDIVDNRDRAYKWGDVEKALGNIDYIATYNECNDDVEIDYDHMMQTAATLEDKPQQMLEEILDRLHITFENWINSIDVSADKDDTLYLFNPDGIFLNFNYTDTLEVIYNIPRSSITYIHGRRKSRDELILGHGTEINPSNAFLENNAIYEDNAYLGIINTANAQRKKVDEIIASKNEFWHSIVNVDRVITYGHSFSEVDFPYFKAIFNSVDYEAEWHFGCHNETDQANAENLVNYLGIAKKHYCRFGF